MLPWLWLWAPQWQVPVHLPLSGDVAQRIEPDTNWFFGAIPQAAGDGQIERQAFAVASYGRQLGLLTEAVLGLAADAPPRGAQARQALERLAQIAQQIDALKQAHDEDLAATLADQLAALKQRRPQAHARLMRRLDGEAGTPDAPAPVAALPAPAKASKRARGRRRASA